MRWTSELKGLAEQAVLSSFALGSYKADDIKDLSQYALVKLAKFYNVTTDYLLGLSKMKSHPNADLANLRLSDGMIDLLKSGRIDNAMLCELAAHQVFAKLPADIQIYVEGIAAMQIQNLNAWVDVARAEVVEKYQPGENDRTTYLLQAAHVDRGNISSVECIVILTRSWQTCGRSTVAGATAHRETLPQKN